MLPLGFPMSADSPVPVSGTVVRRRNDVRVTAGESENR